MIKKITLIFIILCFKFVSYAQYNDPLDSLIKLAYSDELADDTIKANRFFQLAELAHKYKADGPGKVINQFIDEGFILSYKLNYSKGIDKYCQLSAKCYDLKVLVPSVYQKPYNDGVNKKILKSLYKYRKKIHGGAIDSYHEDIITKLISLHRYKEVANLRFWNGLALFDNSMNVDALKFFKLAYNLALKADDHILSAHILMYEGVIYYFQNKLDSSKYCFLEAVNLSSKHSDSIKIAACYNNIGEICYKNKDFDQASEYFQKSVGIYRKIKDSSNLLMTLCNAGKTFIELNDYKSAEKFLNESKNIALNKHFHEILRDIFYYFSILNFQMMNFEKSLFYHKQFERYKDSLFLHEMNNFVKSREDFWQEKIGREISRKEKESIDKKITSLELKKNNFYLITSLIAIIITVIFVIFLYKTVQSKKKANRYLSELNETRNIFFSIISHDLRGPLSSFINLLRPLQNQIKNLSKEQLLEHLTALDYQARKNYLLLDNLLNWSKLQRGYLIAEKEHFPIAEVINLTIALYENFANDKNIQVKSDIDYDIMIYADRNMIDTVIRNILNNALKFTNQNGFINIECINQEKFYKIIIRDNGIGLNAEQKEKLFSNEIHIQNKSGKSNKIGLGLILCREFIEKNDGLIGAESEGINKGTTFWFTVLKSNPDSGFEK